MPIKNKSVIALATLIAPVVWAQSAPKPGSALAAVAPVETIQLNGRVLPLNIKTLADLQRVSDEIALQEKLKETLKKSQGLSLAAKADNPLSRPAAPVLKSKPMSRDRPENTLVAVFGTTDDMRAQIRTTGAQSIVVKTGDLVGKQRVKQISAGSVTLVSSDGSTRSVQVGQQAVF